MFKEENLFCTTQYSCPPVICQLCENIHRTVFYRDTSQSLSTNLRLTLTNMKNLRKQQMSNKKKLRYGMISLLLKRLNTVVLWQTAVTRIHELYDISLTLIVFVSYTYEQLFNGKLWRLKAFRSILCVIDASTLSLHYIHWENIGFGIY